MNLTFKPLFFMALTCLLALGGLELNATASLSEQWQIVRQGPSLDHFPQVVWYYTLLPRWLLALLVGALMGLTGSLFQQLTRNPLLSPMTAGASSGAWLALVIAGIYWPSLSFELKPWAAMAGAIIASVMVVSIAGRRGLGGLPLILAGMAVNILLGALANGVILLHDQYAQGLFVWGAGDLTQYDWQWWSWIWPKVWVAGLIVLLAPRILTLLRLGDQNAQARGLSLLPAMGALALLGLWLVACSITAVGLIGFIGLLSPNLVRAGGVRRARSELLASAVLGAVLLVVADALAQWLSQNVLADLLPTGSATALFGAPALLWLCRRRMSATDHQALTLPHGAERFGRNKFMLLMCLTVAAVMVSLALAPTLSGWRFQWPDALTLAFRWPRIVSAFAAGGLMAVSGVILQRLIKNPLASPDIIGMSAGASLSLLVGYLVFGAVVLAFAPLLAFAGALLTLVILLLLAKRHQYAPGIVILLGIALSALMGSIESFVFAGGSQDIYALKTWLSGSTAQIGALQAWQLLAGLLVFSALALVAQRALMLLGCGDAMAQARGLDLKKTRLALMLLVALICAWVTALLGPVSFVGLLAPHMAVMLGGRKPGTQLLLALFLGGLLMLISDWLGRVAIYPMQLPAGTLASIIGGSYFMLLLLKRR